MTPREREVLSFRQGLENLRRAEEKCPGCAEARLLLALGEVAGAPSCCDWHRRARAALALYFT